MSNASSNRTQASRPRAGEWLFALGALMSLAFLLAAVSDFGDPMAAAKQDVKEAARDRAESVRDAWKYLLVSSADPAEPMGLAVEFGERKNRDQVARATVPSERITQVLIESALYEAAAGRRDAAIADMEDALLRTPEDPRAGEARLHLARWYSAKGDFESVEAQRMRLLPNEPLPPPTAWIDGTSTMLLATFVEPVAPDLAKRVLEEGARDHLPPPRDRIVLTEAGLVFQEDPWWSVLQGRLASALPSLDWDQLFLREERVSEAAAERFADELASVEDAWTIQRMDGVEIAARTFGSTQRVLAVEPSGLAHSMSVSMESRDDNPYQVVFDGDDAGGAEEVLGRRTLGAGELGYSIHRDDPYRSGRRERMQLRLVRAGLLLLSLAILVTSVMSYRATDKARRLAALRSTFVASVSHDLRTPIQSMLLMAETLEGGRVATETGRARYFSSIRREAHRLRRLVEDLLDGARIDRGEGARIERRTVDTARFLTELETMMREHAERSDGALTFTHGSLPPELSFDPDGVHRAVWNLFENALKYGRHGEQTARVSVTFDYADDALIATVEDEGPGIPARYADSVFDPFERVRAEDSDRIEKDTGTGLGLSIVRAISSAHGGEARLEPSQGGARFVATFLAGTGSQEVA